MNMFFKVSSMIFLTAPLWATAEAPSTCEQQYTQTVASCMLNLSDPSECKAAAETQLGTCQKTQAVASPSTSIQTAKDDHWLATFDPNLDSDSL